MTNQLFELKPYTRKGSSDYYKKEFQTNTKTCRYMVSLLPKGTRTVLEPTPGDGNLVRALAMYDVTAPEDFFLLKKERYDAVVMNPPFSSKYAMPRKTFEYSRIQTVIIELVKGYDGETIFKLFQ